MNSTPVALDRLGPQPRHKATLHAAVIATL
jgi:hypothetical protein